jgi:8-hydroxy-5-deazaflavin:NADPH oxidoreductase
MKVGIIGAGNIGGTLTRRLTKLGHEVFVANSRGPETLASLARETGAKAVTVAEAARAGEVVVVTIPEGRIRNLPKNLFAGLPDNVVIVDTGNYYPNGNAEYAREADGFIEEVEAGMSESRWVERQLGRPVVKAFNNIYFQHLMDLGRPKGAPGRIALPVAGDDSRAKAVILKLVNELGFDGVDAGGLDESWRQQPGTPAYCTNLDAEGLQRALSEASLERKPELRSTAKTRSSSARHS